MKTILTFMGLLLMVAVSYSAVPCFDYGVPDNSAIVQVADVGGLDSDAFRFEYALPAYGIYLVEYSPIKSGAVPAEVKEVKSGDCSWHYPHAFY